MLRRATTAPLPPRRTTRAQPATTAPQARAITTGAQQENILRRRSQPALTAPVGSTRTLLLSQAARPAPQYVHQLHLHTRASGFQPCHSLLAALPC